jgi:hypothetical protein
MSTENRHDFCCLEWEESLEVSANKDSSKRISEVEITFNPLTPNGLLRRRAVSHLKIKISSKNMREIPSNATIIHSVY